MSGVQLPAQVIGLRWATDRDRSRPTALCAATPPAEDNEGMGRRGVFLDLNGTLVEPLKPERLDEITLIPGVVEAVARLSAAGFVCPVITVQSRIAKGLFSLPEFEIWFASFAAGLQVQGALVVGPYVCPHRFVDPCPCKKPNTLLYDRAVAEYQLKPAECFVIGDSPEDVRAARTPRSARMPSADRMGD